jgi:hypothetical protein
VRRVGLALDFTHNKPPPLAVSLENSRFVVYWDQLSSFCAGLSGSETYSTSTKGGTS